MVFPSKRFYSSDCGSIVVEIGVAQHPKKNSAPVDTGAYWLSDVNDLFLGASLLCYFFCLTPRCCVHIGTTEKRSLWSLCMFSMAKTTSQNSALNYRIYSVFGLLMMGLNVRERGG